MLFTKTKLFTIFMTIPLLYFTSCTNPVRGQSDEAYENYKLHVTPSDYTRENLKEILKSENNQEMAELGFFTNEPIQAEITDDGNLKVTSYAPVTIKNVKITTHIKGRNDNSAALALPLAFFDEIYGFSQSITPLPANLNQSKENTEFKISADDQYWEKISTIKQPLKITFSQDNSGPWQNMTPEAARKSVIVGTTMSYMFNHKDYKTHLKNWNEGGYAGKGVTYEPIPGFVMPLLPSAPFKDDNGNNLSYETVYNQAINKGQINFSLIKESEPAGGIGGGNTLGLRNYLFDNFLKYKTLPVTGQKTKDLKCTTIDIIFHELAHCMGYYHPDDIKNNPYPGTMTYGGGWTTANYVFINKLIENNDLPIPLDGTWNENLYFPFY